MLLYTILAVCSEQPITWEDQSELLCNSSCITCYKSSWCSMHQGRLSRVQQWKQDMTASFCVNTEWSLTLQSLSLCFCSFTISLQREQRIKKRKQSDRQGLKWPQWKREINQACCSCRLTNTTIWSPLKLLKTKMQTSQNGNCHHYFCVRNRQKLKSLMG